MLIGCCNSLTSQKHEGVALDWIETLKNIGYDYIELALMQVMELSEEDFARLLDKIHEVGIPCPVCNCFFPAAVRVTGPDVDQGAVGRYLSAAVARAHALGVDTIVFGSAGARNVPEGFDKAQAWEQLVDLLRRADEIARPAGITVVIEPLNYGESNIINTVLEGFALAGEVARPGVRLLVDYYHFALNREPFDEIGQCASAIRHMHIANPEKRAYPFETDRNDYTPFFGAVRAIGYTRRLSVEGVTSDLAADAAASLKFLRKALCGQI